ncbi:MAG TPA: VIT family protein, partial [Patescibacteria group bacterium]|nr:VIT family protein [Patescibacteria group bacterium]
MSEKTSLEKPVHHSKDDSHGPNHTAKLNWLRAAVLGAGDGIVSVAGLVVGVAGATTHQGVILAAGLAGIIAGAISMAAGEYVSVSSSRDTEKALLEKERYELQHHPEAELEELACIYEKKGLSKKTAMVVAQELSINDAAAAHFDAELGIDPDNLTDPWHAAYASAISFLIGALIPLIAILLPPESLRIPITFISVLVALFIAGVLSAKVSGASVLKATFRVVVGGAIAMVVTYSIGKI